MPLQIVTIPCLADNYAFLLHDAATRATLSQPTWLSVQDGALHVTKVLSTGALRGRVESVAGRTVLVSGLPVGGERLIGWTVSAPGRAAVATIRGGEGATIELDGVAAIPTGSTFACATGEPAPVVGARLLTGTPVGMPLPPLRFRLATTRGTNALLERRGARVAFFVTEGFADLLTIGTQQRDDLFALQIRRPEPLEAVTVEVSESMGPDGTSEHTPDLDAIARRARELPGGALQGERGARRPRRDRDAGPDRDSARRALE